MAAADISVPQASTSAIHNDAGAGNSKTLQATDERRQKKRKRNDEVTLPNEREDSTGSSKGKAKAVSFGDVTGKVTAAPSEHDGLGSILKSSDQDDAAKTGKGKTTAKKRYLKAKMARYKAKKKEDRPQKSQSSTSVAGGETEDATDGLGVDEMESEATAETPEQKRARKKAKREERRNAEAEAQNTFGIAVEEQHADALMDQQDTAAAIEDKAQRRADRKASKGKSKPDADVSSDNRATRIAALEESAATRKEEAMTAKLDDMKSRQAKANKRAKAKLQYGENGVVTEGDDEDKQVPTQPDALPRFPKPLRPLAPSQRDLDDMLISHDLKDALAVDQSSTLPVSELQKQQPNAALSSRMQERLKEMNIDSFFAVQAAILPILMQDRQMYVSRKRPRDVCVSAPTGSGKTLSYVIPVVEILAARVVTRVRTLVVLPTRELAVQVRDVFEKVCKGTGLKIACITGQHAFAAEQSSLVGNTTSVLQGGSSKIDILVATPGRLMDHLKSTPNFTLQHLRFLIVDEADRLLGQNFNDWVKAVMAHLEDAHLDDVPIDAANEVAIEVDAVAPRLRPRKSGPQARSTRPMDYGPQKLLFSATLTRDPTRIAALRLHKPAYVSVVEKTASTTADGQTALVLLDNDRHFALPDSLQENMIVTRTSDKALVLLHLLKHLDLQSALCFTKSIESAARLSMLVEAFEAGSQPNSSQSGVAHYSSELGPSQRKAILDDFRKGKLRMLICSDLVARGLDIPIVANVINYDVPVDIRKYVHRVGRTARAGRSGTAWTLVESQEAKYFKTLLDEAGRLQKVRNVKVRHQELADLEATYEMAMQTLRE